MRTAIGGTWVSQLIIIFMFIFVAYLALSINYSKAFRVKNETLTFIEKKEGITKESIKYINSYLKNSGYDSKGTCEDMGENVYGVSDLNSAKFSLVKNFKTEYYYCISKYKEPAVNFKNKASYEVRLFFKFNLPVLGDLSIINVDGQTKDVIYPADGDCKKAGAIKCNK